MDDTRASREKFNICHGLLSINLTCRHAAVCETDHERVNSNVVHGEFGSIFQIKQSGIIAKKLHKKSEPSRVTCDVFVAVVVTVRPHVSGYF